METKDGPAIKTQATNRIYPFDPRRTDRCVDIRGDRVGRIYFRLHSVRYLGVQAGGLVRFDSSSDHSLAGHCCNAFFARRFEAHLQQHVSTVGADVAASRVAGSELENCRDDLFARRFVAVALRESHGFSQGTRD